MPAKRHVSRLLFWDSESHLGPRTTNDHSFVLRTVQMVWLGSQALSLRGPSLIFVILTLLLTSTQALIAPAGPNVRELDPIAFKALDRSKPFLVEFYSQYCGSHLNLLISAQDKVTVSPLPLNTNEWRIGCKVHCLWED